MIDYELMVIVHPEVDEDGVTALNEQIGQWISDQGGEVVKTNVWGRRKLAYLVANQTDGIYVVTDFRMVGTNLLELERNLKLNEQVIRFMIVRKSN